MNDTINNIYVIKGQERFGPFSTSDLADAVRGKIFTGNELGWIPSAARAKPLREIIAGANAETAPPEKKYSVLELIQMAAYQRALFALTGFGIIAAVLYALPTESSQWYLGISSALNILAVINGVRLARIMGKNIWVWMLLLLIPYVALGATGFLVRESRRVLRAHGITPHGFGVRQSDLGRLVPDNQTSASSAATTVAAR